ncbi:MAG: GNAT family N-acetyltransferase [Ignavibacteria bacterium]|nr:GNAT family N-acetyltransferase [Ignavibacteria bacterium]
MKMIKKFEKFLKENYEIIFEKGVLIAPDLTYEILPVSATKLSLENFFKNVFSGSLTTEKPFIKDKDGYVEMVGIGINNPNLRGIGLGEKMITLMLEYLKKQGVVGIKSINNSSYADIKGRTKSAEKMWERLRKNKKFIVSKKKYGL